MAPDVLPPSLPAAYTQLAPLARGAFGQVWRARHPRHGEVAVKLLAADLAGDPDAAWRFGQEFRRLAALAIPGIPRAFESGLTADGTPFFSMALAPGAPPVPPLAPQAAADVVAAVARALAGLHAAGLVHGDLKLENVVVAPDGSVTLVDLALAAPIGAPREGFAGTPAYMAPEVWRGAPHAPEADWYALGVLAHWLRSGRPPFPQEGAALVRAHLQEPAPGGDPLLAKDPARRREGSSFLAAEPPPTGLRPASAASPPLDDAAWQQALAQGGRVRLVGPPGAGKTRTLDAWRLEAQAAGLAWLGATAAPGGASVRALVRRALAAAGLAPEGLAAWLAGDLPPAWRELEPAARRAAIARAAGDALAAALARLGPSVLALDDAHQADEASRGLLDALMAHPALAEVPWVLAGTTPGTGPVVNLPPWDAPALQALAEARLGGPLPEGLAAALTAFSTPGELERALGRWLASGALGRSEAATWTFDPTRGGDAPPPPAAPALAARLALAWAAGGLPVAAIGSLAELDALVAAGWATVQGGLARPGDPDAAAAALAPYGDADRQAMAAELAAAVAAAGGPPAVAARLALTAEDAGLILPLVCRAAATALEGLAVQEATALLAAWTPPAPDLAHAFLRGEAARLGDRLDEAVAAYDEAIDLADAGAADPVTAARARIGRAKAHQMRGRYARAAADLAAAEALARPIAPLVAARAAVAAGRVAYFQGDLPAAIAACTRAVAIARAEPAGAVVLSAALNLEGALIAEADPSRATEARARLDEALALALAAGDRVGHGAALENLGNVHLAAGELALARDAFAAYEAACDTATERTSARMNRALALAALGDPQAQALGAAVAQEALERGRPFIASLARLAEGEARWRQLDWPGAWEALDQALALATAAGNRYAEGLVRLARLEAAGALGDPARLEAELAATPDAPETRAAATLARATAAWLAGDAPAAARRAHPLADHPNRALAARALRLLGETALAQGSPEAAGTFQAALAIADGWDARWHQEGAWLGLARAAGPGRQDAWLARILDADAPAGNPLARAAAAALRLADGRAAGQPGLAALARWREALAALPVPEAEALARASGIAAPREAAPGAIEPAALLPWLGALGLAADEDALYDALLAAVLDLAGMARGYLLAYADGRLTSIATRRLDLEAELAEGFSTTIADEALITGEPVYVVDAAGNERFRAAASVVALGLRSVVALPVATPTTMLGVVYADRAAIDPVLAPADLALLRLLAATAAERVLSLRMAARAYAADTWLAILAPLMAAVAATPADRRREAALAVLVAETGAAGGAWLDAGGLPLASTGTLPELPPAWIARALAAPPGLAGPLGEQGWLVLAAAPPGPGAVVLAGPASARLAPDAAGLAALLAGLAPWLASP